MTRCEELPAYRRLGLDVVRASGSWLECRDGRSVLDLYGGHCVNVLGAGDPELGEVLALQWRTLSFVTNLLPCEPRERFRTAFERNLPPGDWRTFVTNSGAEANENALKLALSVTGRTRVVAFEGAFHGRTSAASAVSASKVTGFPRAPFDVERVPWGDLDAVERVAGDAAAIVLEPIQSLAGVVEPPPGFLAELASLAERAGAWLVFDEVQTGTGRLGDPWASQHFDAVPDVFTTAKGAGGGFPIGLTVVRAEHAERCDASLCGSTFGGGPMALVAAAHVAERVARPGFLDGVRACAQRFAALAERPGIARVRGAGLLLGLELDGDRTAADVQRALLDRDVLTGTSWNPSVLRLSPALTLTPDEADGLGRALAAIGIDATPAATNEVLTPPSKENAR